MRHIIRAAVAAVAAVILTATAAGAAVTFDPETGTGFVGKGDVQTAFGWNNKVMQSNHQAVTFTYDSSAQYSQDCQKEGRRETRHHTFKKSVNINAAIVSDSRKTGQWTGWNLLHYGTTSGNGIPTDLCTPGVGEDGQSGWEPVEGAVVTKVEGSESGGLYAWFNGDSRLLQ